MSSAPRLAVVALAAVLAGNVLAGEGMPASLVDRFLSSDGDGLQEYRARRLMRAVNPRFKAQATLEAITELRRDGTFHYEIVSEEGSGHVRSRVLRAVLRDEQRLWERGDPRRSSLSTANYAFRLEDTVPRPGAEESGEASIAITPVRKDVLLVAGRIIVAADTGDLLRVEGRLSKSPSFWTSRVEVVREYARIAGVRVPVRTTSVAHVKIAGRSEFEMTYHYQSINGTALDEPVHVAAK
jgi:hypothetical protein